MAGAEPEVGVGVQGWELVPCPGCAEVSNRQHELCLPPGIAISFLLSPSLRGICPQSWTRLGHVALQEGHQGGTLTIARDCSEAEGTGSLSHASAWPLTPSSAPEDVGEPRGVLDQEGMPRACTSITRGKRDQAGSAQCVMGQVHQHQLRSPVRDTPDAECALVMHQQLMDKTICAEQTLTKGSPHPARCLLSPHVHVFMLCQ